LVRKTNIKVSRFPAPACGGRRLRSKTYLMRATPLVPLTRDGDQSALLCRRQNRTSLFTCTSLDLPNRGRRIAYGSIALVMLLTGCASGPPAPVEDREVDSRVRAPARADSAGVQVFPLQNPAVRELEDQASAAEQGGDFKQASVLLERALRIQPRDPELLQHMAEIKLQQQDYQQALNFAVNSHDVGPRVGELCARNWRTISVAREYLKDSAGARTAEERARQCMNTKPAAL